MNTNNDILRKLARSLLLNSNGPTYLRPGHEIGQSGLLVYQAAHHVREPNPGKAALAGLKAGLVPVPICPRFGIPAVDLEAWAHELSIRDIKQHWQCYPEDEVGFLVQRIHR